MLDATYCNLVVTVILFGVFKVTVNPLIIGFIWVLCKGHLVSLLFRYKLFLIGEIKKINKQGNKSATVHST